MAVADQPQPPQTTQKKTLRLPFDGLLLVALGALLIFGLMMVYSSTFDWSYRLHGNPATIFVRQVQWLVLGLALMFIAARVDYHWWRYLAVPLMIITLILLFAVLILGSTVFNAQRAFFNGSVQPSELAKFVIIVYLAVWLASKGDKIRATGYGLIPFGVIVGTLATLILLQPDLSAAGTIVLIAGLMFFIAGADFLQLGGVGVLAFGTAAILLQLPTNFAATGRQRLADFITALQDITQASWHLKQSAVAFVNGGLFGRGLGESHQKFGFLPTPHTDSIFAIIGEELGLVGCLFVIALYAVLLWRGYRIAAQARDPLGAILASGIVCWLSLEAIVNVAVMVGAFPFAGNPLPFISYGGSNLVVSLIAIGVLLGISRRVETEPLSRKVRATGLLNARFDFGRRDGRRRISRSGGR